MKCTSPHFDDAIGTFREFLRKQGASDRIAWIWRDGILSRRRPGSHAGANRRIFIDQNRFANESEVRHYYAIGAQRQLGVALSVFCQAGPFSICYVDVPEDEASAEQAMMSSLKCTIPDPCPCGILVRSRWLATILRVVIRSAPSAWSISPVPLRPDWE